MLATLILKDMKHPSLYLVIMGMFPLHAAVCRLIAFKDVFMESGCFRNSKIQKFRHFYHSLRAKLASGASEIMDFVSS